MSRKVDNLADEIETLKRKIHLLGVCVCVCVSHCHSAFVTTDGDKTAYYENTQWEMEQNRHRIQQLRQENNLVRKSFSNKMTVRVFLTIVPFKQSFPTG